MRLCFWACLWTVGCIHLNFLLDRFHQIHFWRVKREPEQRVHPNLRKNRTIRFLRCQRHGTHLMNSHLLSGYVLRQIASLLCVVCRNVPLNRSLNKLSIISQLISLITFAANTPIASSELFASGCSHYQTTQGRLRSWLRGQLFQISSLDELWNLYFSTFHSASSVSS